VQQFTTSGGSSNAAAAAAAVSPLSPTSLSITAGASIAPVLRASVDARQAGRLQLRTALQRVCSSAVHAECRDWLARTTPIVNGADDVDDSVDDDNNVVANIKARHGDTLQALVQLDRARAKQAEKTKALTMQLLAAAQAEMQLMTKQDALLATLYEPVKMQLRRIGAQLQQRAVAVENMLRDLTPAQSLATKLDALTTLQHEVLEHRRAVDALNKQIPEVEYDVADLKTALQRNIHRGVFRVASSSSSPTTASSPSPAERIERAKIARHMQLAAHLTRKRDLHEARLFELAALGFPECNPHLAQVHSGLDASAVLAQAAAMPTTVAPAAASASVATAASSTVQDQLPLPIAFAEDDSELKEQGEKEEAKAEPADAASFSQHAAYELYLAAFASRHATASASEEEDEEEEAHVY
jgi:hypothetical protein